MKKKVKAYMGGFKALNNTDYRTDFTFHDLWSNKAFKMIFNKTLQDKKLNNLDRVGGKKTNLDNIEELVIEDKYGQYNLLRTSIKGHIKWLTDRVAQDGIHIRDVHVTSAKYIQKNKKWGMYVVLEGRYTRKQ